MGDYNSTPISQLPPGSVTLATDLYPATDVTDETESPSGTTKKYAVGQLQTFLTNFTDVTTSPQQLSPVGNYIADAGALCTFTLPIVTSIGGTIQIIARGSTYFQIQQNDGQQIFLGASSTTLGNTGYIISTTLGAFLTLTCTQLTSSYQEFHILNNQGSFTLF